MEDMYFNYKSKVLSFQYEVGYLSENPICFYPDDPHFLAYLYNPLHCKKHMPILMIQIFL